MTSWSSGKAYLLRVCILLLLLILTLIQLFFFVLLPNIELHLEYCHVVSSYTQRTITNDALEPPMHLFYKSLYLSPRDVNRLQRSDENENRNKKETHKELILSPMQSKTPMEKRKMQQEITRKHRHSKSLTRLTMETMMDKTKTELSIPRSQRGFFLQTQGQGDDAINSAASYCINLIAPGESVGVLVDFEIYLSALPSARPIRAAYEQNLIQNPNEMKELDGHQYTQSSTSASKPFIVPLSVVDIYLERHPVDRKYYPNIHYPREKRIWMMQNIEFFDRHELNRPEVGVILVKNRIGLKKVIEYRHRQQLGYSVLYTKHTSVDQYDSNLAKERDWNTFLHMAGHSPFKNTKVILRAWALHPEWPKLIVRASQQQLCEWIETKYGDLRDSKNPWTLDNVDFKCGSESESTKKYLQNTNGIHLCPSETEGFGHYLNEARSVGALVITTNVAPMNELIEHEDSGILIGRAKTWWWETKGDLFLPLARVEINDIEYAVHLVQKKTINQRKQMGERARTMYLRDRVYFLNAMSAIEESLCQDAIQIDKLQPYLY